jgi:hypothetical protein
MQSHAVTTHWQQSACSEAGLSSLCASNTACVAPRDATFSAGKHATYPHEVKAQQEDGAVEDAILADDVLWDRKCNLSMTKVSINSSPCDLYSSASLRLYPHLTVGCNHAHHSAARLQGCNTSREGVFMLSHAHMQKIAQTLMLGLA